ncbi:hypothetical protein QR680_012299 [Steinernema hermaphroditum]|uniref:G domain-containing protein n=1 Tax=Steinernema hermaphroditum TaxID=289476 RepID=A0AA39I1K0_9BILA|nr:hypothetical protein QR680_012299 [Steinernema hermaphroditum]
MQCSQFTAKPRRNITITSYRRKRILKTRAFWASLLKSKKNRNARCCKHEVVEKSEEALCSNDSRETGEEENAKEGCDSAVHIVKFTESAIHPTLTAALTKKKILLEIVCPKMCVSQKLRWLCQECKTPVYYGFDYLHCSCGAHSRTCASYRCGHESHGDEFVPLMDSDRDIREIGDCEEINIVLLGEVGAGKSTLINSIFNYLAYKNLEEAANSELKIPIPTSFLLKDDKGIRQRVSVGKKSDNENDVYGETSTQRTKTYEFMHHNENKFYRVIDTPGVGDCRGIEQDKKNFEMIIQEIKKYAKIHAFCILIPAYAARLEVAVQYFIEKLLTQLNQDAAKNIVFCITKSWMNSHRFDQLNRALASHIEKVESEKNVRIALKTMYHFNNESFKFLCARQNGVSCPQLDEFATSWNMSSKNTLRLLNYVSSLEPYWTQKEDKMKEIFWNEKMNEELHLCFITFTVENLLKMQEEKKESLEIDEVLMERQGTQILESDSVEEKEHEEATYTDPKMAHCSKTRHRHGTEDFSDYDKSLLLNYISSFKRYWVHKDKINETASVLLKPVLTNEIMNDMYKVINSSTSTTPSKFNLHGIRSLLETLKIRNAQEEKKESLETGQVPQIVESDSVEEKEDEGTTYMSPSWARNKSKHGKKEEYHRAQTLPLRKRTKRRQQQCVVCRARMQESYKKLKAEIRETKGIEYLENEVARLRKRLEKCKKTLEITITITNYNSLNESETENRHLIEIFEEMFII